MFYNVMFEILAVRQNFVGQNVMLQSRRMLCYSQAECCATVKQNVVLQSGRMLCYSQAECCATVGQNVVLQSGRMLS